jgi:hypothetical protein
MRDIALFWEMFQFSISSRDLECGLDAYMGIQQYSVLFSAGEQEPRFTPSVSQSKSFFITSVRPSLITRSVSTSGWRLIWSAFCGHHGNQACRKSGAMSHEYHDSDRPALCLGIDKHTSEN